MKRFAAISTAAAASGVAAGYAYASYVDAFDPSTWEAAGPPLIVRAYEGLCATGVLLRALSSSVEAQRALATPQDEEALMFKAVVAGILADLCTNGTSERRQIMAAAGGGAVVDWLLRCLRRGGSSEQQEAERALAAMFNDPEVAPRLWTRPSVLPKVLQFMAQSGDTGPLGDALAASVLTPAASGRVALDGLPDKADVELLVSLAGGRHGARVRHVASWALAHWPLLSDQIRVMVAEAGGAQGLLRALEDSHGSYEHAFVRSYVARGLSSLVLVTPPEMIVSWIGPLVGVWEEALRARDLVTAALCMDALTQAIQAADESQRNSVASTILAASADRKRMTRHLGARHRPPQQPPSPSALPDDRATQARPALPAVSSTASTSGSMAFSRSMDHFLDTNPTFKSFLAQLKDFIPRARADTAVSAIPSSSSSSSIDEGHSPNFVELLRRSASAFATSPPAAAAGSAPTPSSQELRAMQRSLCALLSSLAASAPYQLAAFDIGPLLKAVATTFLPPPNQGPDNVTFAASTCLRELSNLPGAFGRAAELLWASEILRFAARSRSENPEGEDGYLGSSFLRNFWVNRRQKAEQDVTNTKRVTPGQEGVKANPASLASALVYDTNVMTDTLLKFMSTSPAQKAVELPVPSSSLDLALWRCLELLGDLSLDHGALLQSLGPCSLMPLLQRIGPDNTRMQGPGSNAAPGSEENVPHLLRRTCLRFLAILALEEPYASSVRSDVKLLRFIRNGVGSEDLRFASHARRALLHLESPPPAEGKARSRIWYPDGVHLLSPDSTNLSDASRSPPGQGWGFDLVFLHGLRGGAFVTWRVGLTEKEKEQQQQQEQKVAGKSVDVKGPREGWEAIGGAMALMGPDSGEPSSSSSAGDAESLPTPGLGTRSSHAYYTLRKDCWPTRWLAADFPSARILSVEYAAPAVDAEGHVLPFDELGSRILDKLVAAGVGQRPVVMVAHSLGGLLAKEMLLQGSHSEPGSGRAQFTESTRGLAFYSVPHFGSWLADLGWRLKRGWAPSPHVAQLRNGPHLDELNEFVRKLHKSKKVEVLSFLETGKTPFYTGPKGYNLYVEVVPLNSAYPGYGDLHALEGRDHINSCKPSSREDVSYNKLEDFIKFVSQPQQKPAAKPQ